MTRSHTSATTTDDTSRLPATIEIFDNEIRLGSATVDNFGNWTYNASNLALGQHLITARSGSLVSDARSFSIVGNPINAIAPRIKEAPPSASDSQQFDYYTVNSDIHVVVPDYNMRPNDTVKVYWVGRSTTLGSEIKTVPNPPKPLEFSISKYEVIDTIGHKNTDVYYTIKRPPDNETIESRHLTLNVTGNSFAIVAPTINDGKNNLRVWRQGEFNNLTTARVRAIGKTEWESDSLVFEQQDYLNYPIDNTWLAANKGSAVRFNYSLRLHNSDTQYLFSQLLRINLP